MGVKEHPLDNSGGEAVKVYAREKTKFMRGNTIEQMSKDMNSILCIYHSRDLDGWTSAAIVKDFYPQAELIGWDYGDPVPDFDIYDYSKIFLVDISFPAFDMQMLPMHAVWIDHHPSAIKDSQEHRYDHLNGVRNTMYAACELTWEFLHSKTLMPDGVHLVGMYDSFRHKKEPLFYQEAVMNFQYAARASVANPAEAAKLLTMDTDPWIDAGKHIFSYMKTEAKSIIKMAYPVEILGHKGMMVNATRFNPANFELDYDEDFFGCFHYNGNNWAVSLYSNGKVDCSVICKDLGGGGHAGAAGFQRDKFDDLEQIFNS